MDKQNNHNVPSEQQEKTEKKKSSLREAVEYAESLAVVFVVMLLIFTFIARPATVDGESMMPTLQNGERLLISNLPYTPQYGDIVIIDEYTSYGRPLVKRVIGMEGDTIGRKAKTSSSVSSPPRVRPSTSTLKRARYMWTDKSSMSRTSSSQPIWTREPSSR